MEMENVIAEAIFDFNPTDSIELTLKVCCGCCASANRDYLFVRAARDVLTLLWL